MATQIDKDNSNLNIYDWTYGGVPILELKRWVDAQIEKGMNTVSLEISWGYYNDIDGLDIKAER